MKQIKFFFIPTLLAVCFLITNSCSQTTTPGSSTVHGAFIASTPCDEISKALFEIPSDTKCELMKWNLTLYQDPKTSAPSDFKLTCIYGLPKQGTKDFMKGAKTIELKGKWAIGKGTNESTEAIVYNLNSDNSPISLFFLKLDENLLHLLDGHKNLFIGNGAWSYTLNRVEPLNTVLPKQTSHITSKGLTSDSSTIGVFDGRTACFNSLMQLNKISDAGCQLTKWRLILYQDPQTHSPTTFLLKTVYVGKGDSTYTNKGKWVIAKGTKTDPEAIIYQLELNPDKPQESLAFLKADDNILFFLDKDKNLLVGNGVFSYTLNRGKK